MARNDGGEVDRRTFVKLAGVACAAPSMAAIPAAGARAMSTIGPKRAIRKALKFGMIRAGDTILEKFRIAKSAGFDGVEMDSPTSLDLNEAIDASKESGLVIPGVVNSVHWSKPFSHPDAAVRAEGREAMETALRDCKQLGGTTVLLVPAVVNKQVSYADAYRRSQAEIRRVLPLAEELQIKILIENVWNHFLLSPLEAARYVDEFESEWVGWYFDVGNIVNYGWPEHWIEALGARIGRLDAKEFSRSKRDNEGLWKGFQVKLLEGDCDWPSVMKSLDSIGYEGWMAAEVGGGDLDHLRDIAERMDRILAS